MLADKLIVNISEMLNMISKIVMSISTSED